MSTLTDARKKAGISTVEMARKLDMSVIDLVAAEIDPQRFPLDKVEDLFRLLTELTRDQGET